MDQSGAKIWINVAIKIDENMNLVEIQQEDPSENYAPTLGWSLGLFLGGSLFLDDEQILFIDDVYL
jgi:hypothetical protein